MEYPFLLKFVIAFTIVSASLLVLLCLANPAAAKDAFISLFEKRKKKKSIGSVDLGGFDDEPIPIKGINFCDIDDSMVGDFEGYIRIQKSNRHDPYAIGVYKGRRRIGYLPRGNKELYQRLLEEGGKADAEGYIVKRVDEESGRKFYYGEVEFINI